MVFLFILTKLNSHIGVQLSHLALASRPKETAQTDKKIPLLMVTSAIKW